ncbi:MAG: lipopolysaccharide heptosyltransferase I [Deltaproteobacteria bacterium]|nr:lipopolysaccharide heptosyltransferase I [Candidatus Anaeroferrophillacea bacterium]
MRVLIVKVSALGDVVHTLPVLAYLTQTAPGVEIDWLVEEESAPLLEGHPLIAEVLRLRTRHWRTLGLYGMMQEFFTFAAALRRRHYDLVLDLQGNAKSGMFTVVARGNNKYGFDRDEVREPLNLLAGGRRVALLPAERAVARRALAVARTALPGGGDVPLTGPLHLVPEARAAVRRRLKVEGWNRKPLAVLHYGTTWATKLWAREHWQTLAARLTREQEIQILLTWGNERERTAAESIAAAAGRRAALWPRTSLPELAALLAEADVAVGGDTGPIHVAAALGTPTVSIYRATDGNRNGPPGDRHIRLQAPRSCSPCLRKHCDRDTVCARSISPEEVYAAVAGRLDRASITKPESMAMPPPEIPAAGADNP